MMTVIGCSQCKKQSNLSIEFKFTARIDCCKECHNTRESQCSFFFCDLKCFLEWFRGIEEDGLQIPCWECHGTGYMAGFEQNGTCRLCKGLKVVMGCEMLGFSNEKI